jgi:hypothetical protein
MTISGGPDATAWKAVLSFSSYEETLDAAQRLLEMARGSDPPSSLLAAAAAIPLLAALEQALRLRVQRVALERLKGPWKKLEVQDALEVAFSDQSISLRLDGFVRAFSGGALRINHRSERIKAVRSLMDLRNRLAHVPEKSLVFSASDFHVNERGDLEFRIPADFLSKASDNPWLSADVEEISRFGHAVSSFISEIIEQEVDSWRTTDWVQTT